MLSAEEGRARLEAVADPHWLEKAGARARKVQRLLRKPAAAILAPDPPYSSEGYERHRQRLLELALELDRLPPNLRAELMTALHPGLGPALARWWLDAVDQPYTAGWGRRAFRAPRNPELTAEHRMDVLRRVVGAVGPYTGDASWLSTWAPYIPVTSYGDGLADNDCGQLLAAAIDRGGPDGQAAFDTLTAIGRGEHPIGMMGRHVIVALLRASSAEGWSFIERLLLAAQRQEGLRQSILEAVDEAHPDAFDRVLGVVLEHDLLRFAATVRAASVWLGFQADVEQIPEVRRRVERLRLLRSNASARQAALDEGDGWETYTALCALAMRDVVEAMKSAERIIARRPADARAAAVRFAHAARITTATDLGWKAVDDEDLGVAWLAFSLVQYSHDQAPRDGFERLERLARRLPETEKSLDPIGIEASPIAVSRPPVVAAMLRARRDRPLRSLLPWLPAMDPHTRSLMADAIGEEGRRLTPDLRATVLAMVGDRSTQVRDEAVKAMAKLRIEPADAPPLEALLTRKAGDLRRGVITLLASLPAADVVRSAERLWQGDTAQRDAACELLREVKDRPGVDDVAARFSTSPLSDRQAELLGDVLGKPSAAGAYADDPGLGLLKPVRRTPVTQPVAPKGRRSFVSDAACRTVGALDDLTESHRDTTLVLTTWQGASEVLLADAQWLPSPFAQWMPVQAESEAPGLILPDVYRPWWQGRPATLQGETPDLDALRALGALRVSVYLKHSAVYLHHEQAEWWGRLLEQLGGGPVGELRHAAVVDHVLSWMLADHATGAAVDECLDAVSASLAGVPATAIRGLVHPREKYQWYPDFRNAIAHSHPWLDVLNGLHRLHPDLFDGPRIGRWFRLLRWLDEPVAGAHRRPVDPSLVTRAFELGTANEDDVLDRMLVRHSGPMLATFTRRRRADVVAGHPDVVAIADRVRQRVLDIELARGELATSASAVAFELGSISGAAVVARLLAGLGRGTLVRGYLGHNEGREAVYSHLVRVSHPGDGETGTTLRDAAKAAGVNDQRLLELAVYAPQWADRVEEALGWPGLADGVWWFHAHTKDDQWSVADEVRETWAALSAERTPLGAEDLVAGAVDVAWYHRSREALGEARWRKLHSVAKLASGGNGHRRAQLFAEAMSGDVGEPAVVERIRAKRHQDSVRALGLVPLPGDPDDKKATMLRRYRVLREFERGSLQFGSQRQASEKTAVRIAIENLARTGGMADPQRFVWAMEAAEAGDLADGPVTVAADAGVAVTLAVDVEGVPSISVKRGDRILKSVPPTAKKAPEVAELLARKTALTRQARRVRTSLETAMVNEDSFTSEDLAGLDRHPVVAPMLSLVVFVDEDGRLVRRAAVGRFVDAHGAFVGVDGRLRLAHPTDLLAAGEWLAWQEQLFGDAHRQPFKQVFRELYLLTGAERAAGPGTHRYEGHQVQPRQAAALLGRRGWLVDREGGDVSRVFHAHGIAARLEFLNGFLTPAEVELPTIKAVYFTRRGEWLAENIEAVPPIVFSEAMRDLDLVVSVAHAGGVDPEASHSTVEMRAALVRETTRVLRLDNVREVNSHVVIEGALGEYSVHLGSGVVHRRPGGAVCIIPVDSQRRGRIFLPFADDDPKTAEVVAKVLLLAKDREIKDPTILSQLRS